MWSVFLRPISRPTCRREFAHSESSGQRSVRALDGVCAAGVGNGGGVWGQTDIHTQCSSTTGTTHTHTYTPIYNIQDTLTLIHCLCIAASSSVQSKQCGVPRSERWTGHRKWHGSSNTGLPHLTTHTLWWDSYTPIHTHTPIHTDMQNRTCQAHVTGYQPADFGL